MIILCAILVSIVAYQLLLTVIFILSKEDEHLLMILAIFIPYSITKLLYSMSKHWKLKNFQRNYNGYYFYHEGSTGPLTIYIHNKDAKLFNQDETTPFYIKKVTEGSNCKRMADKRNIYKEKKNYFNKATAIQLYLIRIEDYMVSK